MKVERIDNKENSSLMRLPAISFKTQSICINISRTARSIIVSLIVIIDLESGYFSSWILDQNTRYGHIKTHTFPFKSALSSHRECFSIVLMNAIFLLLDQMSGQLHEIEGKDTDATLSKYLLMYIQNCFFWLKNWVKLKNDR